MGIPLKVLIRNLDNAIDAIKGMTPKKKQLIQQRAALIRKLNWGEDPAGQMATYEARKARTTSLGEQEQKLLLRHLNDSEREIDRIKLKADYYRKQNKDVPEDLKRKYWELDDKRKGWRFELDNPHYEAPPPGGVNETPKKGNLAAIPVATAPAFQDRIDNPGNYPVIENDNGSVSTHLMATMEQDGKYYAFPMISQLEDGSLYRFDNPADALRYNLMFNNVKQFPNAESADAYARGGYKTDEFKNYYRETSRNVPRGTTDQPGERQRIEDQYGLSTPAMLDRYLYQGKPQEHNNDFKPAYPDETALWGLSEIPVGYVDLAAMAAPYTLPGKLYELATNKSSRKGLEKIRDRTAEYWRKDLKEPETASEKTLAGIMSLLF